MIKNWILIYWSIYSQNFIFASLCITIWIFLYVFVKGLNSYLSQGLQTYKIIKTNLYSSRMQDLKWGLAYSIKSWNNTKYSKYFHSRVSKWVRALDGITVHILCASSLRNPGPLRRLKDIVHRDMTLCSQAIGPIIQYDE